jgi:hypothetical protein
MHTTAADWNSFDIHLAPEPDHDRTYRVTFTHLCRQHEHRPEGGPRGESTGSVAVVLVHLVGDEALLECHEPSVPVPGLGRHDYEVRALELVMTKTAEVGA